MIVHPTSRLVSLFWFLLTTALLFLVTGATAAPSHSFSVAFSANLLGEYEPCG